MTGPKNGLTLRRFRVVFARVAEIAKARWPAVFADFSSEPIDGIGEWTTPNVKV